MLNSIKINFSRVRYILDTEKFKIIFLTIFSTCFFSFFNILPSISYSEALFNYISSSIFLFPLISIVFISSCIFLESFDKDYSTLLRFNDKMDYLKKLLISISIGNFIIFLSAIVIGILFVTFKYFGLMTFSDVEYYNISYVMYSIFTIVKYFIIINILSLIGICVYKIFGKIIGYVYYLIILALYYCHPISSNIIGHFSIKSLNFKYYLTSTQFASFNLEVSHTIIFTCILFLLLALFIYLLIKFNKIRIDE